MAEQSSERTHDPTPHRRQQAREKGEVVFSHDLGSAAVLFAGILALMLLGGGLTDYFSGLLRRQLGETGPLAVNREFAVQSYDGIVSGLSKAALPILGLLFTAAVAATLLQIGLLFTPSRITPDIGRLSPIRGYHRIVSLSGMMRLGFGLFKVLVVSVVASAVIFSSWKDLVSLSGKEIGQIASFLASILLTTMLWCGIALMVLAIFDYAFQRWRHERDLRMTLQEVREEMKEMQGDPQIFARRRAIQRQMVLHRMSEAVPKADVVVTNPTELAVAIRYDPHEMAAPIVVAKGAGVLAQRIRRLALEHNIPIV
ncbi:MAG: EscU/YscU/HrcU family type III secretion system export apparatus switch protein, partial [Pirellulales bacterium]|nr:EscU/YscU/HrcU family type III secretion system export apparatus switch protein [Pirellulales bacterium]